MHVTGTVEEHIDRTNLGGDGSNRCRICNVELIRLLAGNLLELMEVPGIQIAGNDDRPLRHPPAGRRFTDPLPCPGDETAFTFESVHS